jgi:superoxide dismutase, Cu-Zn family
MSRILVFLCLLLIVPRVVSAQAQSAGTGTVVKLSNVQGQNIGTATLSAVSDGVQIALDVKGLPLGDHAIHVHQVAKCEGPDFKSAGPHFNPDGKQHGLQNPNGSHAGDMPNFTVGADGNARTTVLAPNLTLGSDAHSVFSGSGTALVIHAKADDLKTDPAGNAGDRIACGLIQK